MKKLMTTMLAVAAGVGLHAAGMADTGTSFEGLTGDAPYDIFEIDSAGDTGGELTQLTAGETYWVTNGTETLTVVAGTSLEANNQRPNQYADKDQYKYLSIKTTLGNPVTRKVNKFDPEHVVVNPEDIGSGYYFDSLVKFTAFEGEQTVDLNGGKLAIWLQENLGANDEPVSTNLVVTAGFLDSSLEEKAYATNYVCTVPDVNLNDGAWHRVTVKAIESIYKAGIAPVPGFVVFVDKKKVVCGDDKGIINKSSLTDNAYILDSEDALFPSADQISANKLKIDAVQFDGQGDVDDLVFTSTAPDFARDAEFFAINLGEHVTGVQGLINGEDVFNISAATSIVWVSGQTIQIIDDDVTCDSGWMFGSVTNEAGTAVAVESPYTTTAGGSITVTARKLGATVTGDLSGTYETLDDAMLAINALQSGAVTLTLNDSATGGINLDAANVSVVLDLAGNNISAVDGDPAAIYLTAGTLIITNTTGTIGHVVGLPPADQESDPVPAVVLEDGNLTLAGGYYDGIVPSQGYTIIGTGISIAENSSNLEDLQDCVIDGYMLEPLLGGSYYLVVEKPVARTWTVTFLNDGDTYDTVEVEDGQVCALPEAPTKEHYTFAGWYPYNIGALQPYDFTQPITADVTVEAHYTADTYTVSFDTAGGSVLPAIPDQSVAYNEKATDPNVTPVKVGYEFQYWSEDGSTEFDFVNTAIISNTTLTAIYDAIDYTITYMYGESALSGLTPATYTIQDAVTLPSEVDLGVVGVAFEAWTNAEGQVVASWAAGAKNGNQTFYAQVSAVTPPTKYEPGEEGITPPAGKTAAQFAEEINENKAAYIDAPSTTDVANTANYLALFHAVADTEAGTVSIELTTGAYEIEQIAANATATAIASNFAASTVEIAAQPGLWYSISSGSTLTGMTEGTRVMATDSNLSEGKLTLTLPETTGTGFYKVNVNLADKPAPVPNP